MLKHKMYHILRVESLNFQCPLARCSEVRLGVPRGKKSCANSLIFKPLGS